MKRITFYVMLPGLIALFFISCSSPVSTGGGTGTETVNTFAMRPDGHPAAGATARIIDARWWFDSISRGASPILGEAVAGSDGHIRITYPKHQGSVNLQIDHPDAGFLLALPEQHEADPDTVHLQPYASFTGSIVSEETSSSATSIVLTGSSYKQTVQAAGAFSFEKVAAGPYALLCLADAISSPVAVVGGTAMTLTEGVSTDFLSVALNTDRVLIDNFESGIGPTSLGRIFPVLGWYVLSDSLYYQWDTTGQCWKEKKTSIIGTSPITFDSTADGNNGSTFSVSTKLDTTSPYANALFGFSLKPLSERGVDLTAMTGFSFRASGTGTVQIHFETHDLDSASNLQSQYSFQFKLQPAMRNYSIPIDSLRITEPLLYAAAHPWSREAKRVLRIEFEFTASVNTRGVWLTMSLDDFYLEGVSMVSLRGEQ